MSIGLSPPPPPHTLKVCGEVNGEVAVTSPKRGGGEVIGEVKRGGQGPSAPLPTSTERSTAHTKVRSEKSHVIIKVEKMSLIAKSQEQAAATVGVSSRTFARWLSLGCPGKSKRYVISEVVAWAQKNIWNKSDDIRDEMRSIDVEMKRLTLQERLGALVSREGVSRGLRSFTTAIRGSFEKLEREHGSDALDLVLEPIDELDAAIESFDELVEDGK